MKYGQVFVRAINKDGKWGSVDIMKLDDKSFKAFVLDILHRNELIVGINPDMLPHPEIELHEEK